MNAALRSLMSTYRVVQPYGSHRAQLRWGCRRDIPGAQEQAGVKEPQRLETARLELHLRNKQACSVITEHVFAQCCSGLPVPAWEGPGLGFAALRG